MDDFDFNEQNDQTFLPTGITLRKIKSELVQEKRQAGTNMADAAAFARVYAKCVMELSIIPFKMVCSLLSQRKNLCDTPGFNQKVIYLDATYSIVIKQDDYSKRVYYCPSSSF